MRTTEILRLTVVFVVAIFCTSCATPPGSERHSELGRNDGDGAVGLVIWLPEQVKGSVWLQFERHNDQGKPTGIPVSLHVESPMPTWGSSHKDRPGFRAFTMAFPLAPGKFGFSRWVAELEGGTAVSAYVGWPFEVAERQLVHLGHITLELIPVSTGKLEYRLTSDDAQPADSALLQRRLDVLRAFPARTVSMSKGSAATGVATFGHNSFRLIHSSTSVYIK